MKLKVKKTIEKHNMIEKGDSVLLALSGGPDSLCLFDVLDKLKDELGFSFAALHVNHKIRTDADSDASWLKDYCAKRNVPLTIIEADIPKLAKEKGLSEEECGRNIRYEALFSEAKKNPNTKIALAHNRNDQAETVLMRIIRGTGVHGLSAMEYKREDGIIRPLLDIDRTEIEKYCEDNNLNPRIDSTNSETDYFRNKIRLQLIPMLKEYNPGIVDSLLRLSAGAREDDNALLEIAEEILNRPQKIETTFEGTSEFVVKKEINIKEIIGLPDAVLKRVISKAFYDAGLTEDISAVHINALCESIRKNVGGKTIEFPHGYRAVIKNKKLIITKLI